MVLNDSVLKLRTYQIEIQDHDMSKLKTFHFKSLITLIITNDL